MLFKFCRCGKKILIEEKYCNKCKEEIEKSNRKRYKRYKDNRTDIKEQQFYNSSEWKSKREYILGKYSYIDIYAYYTEGVIIPADTIHHIVELKDNWDKRLDSFNLLCCSKESHQEIHKKYKDNKSKIIKELNEMLEKFREEFEIILN